MTITLTFDVTEASAANGQRHVMTLTEQHTGLVPFTLNGEARIDPESGAITARQECLNMLTRHGWTLSGA